MRYCEDPICLKGLGLRVARRKNSTNKKQLPKRLPWRRPSPRLHTHTHTHMHTAVGRRPQLLVTWASLKDSWGVPVGW